MYKVQLVKFLLWLMFFMFYVRNLCQAQGHKDHPLYFLVEILWFLDFYNWVNNPFQVHLCIWYKGWVNICYQLFHYHLLKRLFFLCWIQPLLEISWPYKFGFILFCSSDLFLCPFASFMLSSLLWLHSKLGNQVV